MKLAIVFISTCMTLSLCALANPTKTGSTSDCGPSSSSENESVELLLAKLQGRAERSGCCSYHGGVCGCYGGRASCCDSTLSPSCGCNKLEN